MALLVLSAMFAAPAQAALSPSQLDDLETRICSQASGLQRAQAAVEDMRREARSGTTVPAGNVDAQRQAAMQQQFQQRLMGAQQSIVESTRDELKAAKAAYRQATGDEFVTRLCTNGIMRNTHKQREQQQREAQQDATSAMMQRVLQEGEEVRRIVARDREACMARRTLDNNQGTPAELDAARREYTTFNAAYQRMYSRPFDPSRCPR